MKIKEISNKKVSQIVTFYFSSYGFTIADIARHFKLPYRTVYNVFRNKKYGHLFTFQNAMGLLMSTQPR